jgi:hypothetical protein
MRGYDGFHTSQIFNLLPPDWWPERLEFHAADVPILARPFKFSNVTEFTTVTKMPRFCHLG